RVALASVLTTVLIAAGPLPVTAAQYSEDADAIRARIDAYLSGWNAHDAAGLAAFFTEDADSVMGNQPAAHGREEIREQWQAYFAQQEPERHLTLEVSPIRFLATGVAVMTVATTTGGRDSRGQELTARRFRGAWLWRLQGDDWLIAAMRGLPTEQDRVTLNATDAAAERLKPDVRAFVATYENAFNSHDPAALGSLFRDDAELIIRNLAPIRGRSAIEDWWRTYFTEPRPYRALMIVDEMREIAPNVILLNITATGDLASSADQRPPARYARGTWILSRAAGEWRVAAMWVLPSEDDALIRGGGS
ncbi:MAG: SgcJ/EcaC family oxidoreductase, partial [Acidobacteriota bacterium]